MVLVSNEWLNNKDDDQNPATALNSTVLDSSPTAQAIRGVLQTSIVQSQDNNDTSDKHCDGAIAEAGEVAAAATAPAGGKRHRTGHCSKSKRKMDVNKSDDEMLDLTACEKHENETREQQPRDSTDGGTNTMLDNTIGAIESSNLEAVNNNLEEYIVDLTQRSSPSCDSNTNTLQGFVLRQATLQNEQYPQQKHQPFSQQTLNMALNSAIGANPNNTATSATSSMPSSTNILFNSINMTGLNNGALPQPQQHLPLTEVLNTTSCNSLLVSQPTAELDNCVDTNGEAKIVLQCEAKSHKFEMRTILLNPNQECKVGRLIAKSKASENNAIFDCKVLSRNHAMLWYSPDGRFWVKDTKSSNGTFINDNKLGNEPAELHYGDTVKFGVEVIENSRQEVHGCIIARVTLFYPDGREAISIQDEKVQLTGPNRISFDEIQRLNTFMQEAAQREKMLKAKLSSLQNVLDSTRKNSAMCWQSMITEDQLLHKINLLEKKLQMMEKSVPDNTLRNEIVKLLEDKTTYQLTAKEALRKVYQERCDAMQMMAKMEMTYTASENECTILRTQIQSSKQTLQDFNVRLEQLQQEYTEYKQETLRQQEEAKEQESLRLQQLKEQLYVQEREAEELRLQLNMLQKQIIKQNEEQQLQEQQAIEKLDAAIADMGGDDGDIDDDDDDDEDNKVVEAELAAEMLGEALAQSYEKHDVQPELDKESNGNATPKTKSAKKGKKSNREKEADFELKHKVVRKSTVMKWLKNSDLNKGDGANDVLKAIFNDADSGGEEQEQTTNNASSSPQSSNNSSAYVDMDANVDIDKAVESEAEAAEMASDEFVHNSPKHVNGTRDKLDEADEEQEKDVIEEQQPLVQNANLDNVSINSVDLPQEQAIEMLEAECDFYKQKSVTLASDISALQQQYDELKSQLRQPPSTPLNKSSLNLEGDDENTANQRLDFEQELAEDFASINSEQTEREEELIVYKERLEQSESSNQLLRKEISMLRLKQLAPQGNHTTFICRALPFGCIVLAAFMYFLSGRI